MKSLSIVLPAYNEEANLRTTVAEVAGVEQKMSIDHDGSRDRTGEIGRLHPRVPPGGTLDDC